MIRKKDIYIVLHVVDACTEVQHNIPMNMSRNITVCNVFAILIVIDRTIIVVAVMVES
jgi:hypothetical protein